MKIKNQLKCELARREFWDYCKLMAPKFYKENRIYLKTICTELQEFYESDEQFMLINIGPRHGKSRTATLFVQWILGNNNTLKVMTGSYNETLSTTFSKQVRGAIQEIKADEDKIVYSDIFDKTKIQRGDGAANLWSLEGNNTKNYLATSPTGTATGFGADIILIDDVIKNAQEANNAAVLDAHWDWFTNTMLSRLEGKRKVIIIMTRWASKDLAGRATEHFQNIGIKPRIISMKTYDGENMLCDDILNKQQYDMLMATLGEDIASANYNQEPLDMKGVLYTRLIEYDTLPEIKMRENYTDTADDGEDWLCSIDYAIGVDDLIYILDVCYTKKPMDETEEIVADMLTKNEINYAHIESNNGGKGFSRNVERKCREKGNRKTTFKPFHQSGNKITRILTGSTGVMNTIRFPINWKYKYPEFYRDITTYQRIGKNKHDDGPDCLTGVYEKAETYWKRKSLSGQRL